MVYTRFFDGEDLPFNEREALRYFGYGNGKEPPSQEVKSLFDECVKEALAVCSYKVCYAEFDVTRENNETVLRLGFTKTTSKSLGLNLKGCRKIIAFAATVGIGIDRLIARYSNLSPGKAYAFQAIGAERIETLCDLFNAEIAREYEEKGLITRPRFSCGYGDFSLENQRDFFTALDCHRKIGLTLNDSLLMSPSKSVTAVIGLGDVACRKENNKCSSCNKTDCPFKR